jgi:hypothetical protein
MQKDKKNLTPPAMLSASIFTQAGFTPPAPTNVPQPIPVESLTGKFSVLMSKITAPLLYVGSGAIVTALLMYGVYSASNADRIGKSANNISNLSKTETVAPSVPQTSSGEINSNTRIKTVTVYKEVPVYVDKTKFANNNTEATESNKNIDDAISDAEVNNQHILTKLTLSKPELPSASEYRINRGTPFGNFIPLKPAELRQEFSGTNAKMVLEIHGISGLGYFPYRSIDPEPLVGLNNLSMAFMYELSKNHSLGLALGKESLQMYTVKESGSAISFEKEPRLLWGGVSYKYTMDKIEALYGLSPYFGGILGWTSYGALTKADIGISYYPAGIFSFAIGIQGSALAYQTRSTIKTTQKIGIVYNLGIHF